MHVCVCVCVCVLFFRNIWPGVYEVTTRYITCSGMFGNFRPRAGRVPATRHVLEYRRLVEAVSSKCPPLQPCPFPNGTLISPSVNIGDTTNVSALNFLWAEYYNYVSMTRIYFVFYVDLCTRVHFALVFCRRYL